MVAAFCVIILTVFFIFFQRKKIKIYALKYGVSKYPSKLIFYNDKLSKNLDFAWLFFVIKYYDKIILIDTGYNNEDLTDLYKITYTDPRILLKKIKINPEDITDIIITHNHFDHIGGVHFYQNANIYIQKQELNDFLKNSNLEDVKSFLIGNPNVVTFDEKYELYENFIIKKIGGHSIGSCIVYFVYRGKKYIFTGDECYLYDNINNQTPVGSLNDFDKNQEYIKSLIKEEQAIIIPFHDSLIVEQGKYIKKIE